MTIIKKRTDTLRFSFPLMIITVKFEFHKTLYDLLPSEVVHLYHHKIDSLSSSMSKT